MPSNAPVYRARALAHQGRADPGGVPARVDAPRERVFLVLVLVVAALLAGWVAFARSERVVVADCLLKTPGAGGVTATIWIPQSSGSRLRTGSTVSVLALPGDDGRGSAGAGDRNARTAGAARAEAVVASVGGFRASPPRWLPDGAASGARGGREVVVAFSAGPGQSPVVSAMAEGGAVCRAEIGVGTRPSARAILGLQRA